MFSLLIPFKGGPAAKSRLLMDGQVSHRDLVRAFAADAAQAALDCPLVHEVYAVTNDEFPLAGVRILPDEGAGDLNSAIASAAARLDSAGVAVMVADLPCLTAGDLTAALEQVEHRSFVVDHDGTGTTLIASREGLLRPAYGPGSAALHRASGAVPIAGDFPTLRLDVDTRASLGDAVRLGVGRHTAAALALSSG